MKITYTIQVCNESRELFSLLNFLCKIKDLEDTVHVVVDSLHTTEKVKLVTEYFKEFIKIYERPFDTFYQNMLFHKKNADGDYIFHIDADEMPQELLIKNIKNIINDSKADIIAIPRINIHPGATAEFTNKMKFNVNEAGFINWPDYQLRDYRNCEKVQWTDELHVKLIGGTTVGIQAHTNVALWHIKSIEKQESRWVKDEKNGYTIAPPSDSLYDLLM